MEQIALMGSSTLPAMIQISADKTIQLGELVAGAHAESGFTVAEWNELDEALREEALANHLTALRGDWTPEAQDEADVKAKAEEAAGKKTKPKKSDAPAEPKVVTVEAAAPEEFKMTLLQTTAIGGVLKKAGSIVYLNEKTAKDFLHREIAELSE